MALYVEIKVGDKVVDVYAAQRQEVLKSKDTEHAYGCVRYKEVPTGFEKTENITIVHHKYSDGAAVLAEKVLKAFNKKK